MKQKPPKKRVDKIMDAVFRPDVSRKQYDAVVGRVYELEQFNRLAMKALTMTRAALETVMQNLQDKLKEIE